MKTKFLALLITMAKTKSQSEIYVNKIELARPISWNSLNSSIKWMKLGERKRKKNRVAEEKKTTQKIFAKISLR